MPKFTAEDGVMDDVLGPDESIIFMVDELEDETIRSDSYRAAAIALLDHIANQEVYINREARKTRRESDEALMTMPTLSSATH